MFSARRYDRVSFDAALAEAGSPVEIRYLDTRLTPDTAALASHYLNGLAWSLIPGWWFIALRNFMGAVNRPEPALWITLVTIPANALIAYALIVIQMRRALLKEA